MISEKEKAVKEAWREGEETLRMIIDRYEKESYTDLGVVMGFWGGATAMLLQAAVYGGGKEGAEQVIHAMQTMIVDEAPVFISKTVEEIRVKS